MTSSTVRMEGLSRVTVAVRRRAAEHRRRDKLVERGAETPQRDLEHLPLPVVAGAASAGASIGPDAIALGVIPGSGKLDWQGPGEPQEAALGRGAGCASGIALKASCELG